MEENNKKQPLLKLRELPEELQSYYVLMGFLCIAGYIAIIITALLSGMHKECFYIAVFLSYFAVTKALSYYKTISGKLLVYEGICESKHGKEYNAKNFLNKKSIFTTWSYCYIVITIDVDGEIVKYEVPCKYSLDAKSGDTVRVYTFHDGIYRKNDNTCVINNPLLVKLAKT